jgi:hypothetical protein
VEVPFEHGRHTVPVAAIHRKRRKLPPALQQTENTQMQRSLVC